MPPVQDDERDLLPEFQGDIRSLTAAISVIICCCIKVVVGISSPLSSVTQRLDSLVRTSTLVHHSASQAQPPVKAFLLTTISPDLVPITVTHFSWAQPGSHGCLDLDMGKDNQCAEMDSFD